MIRYFLAKGDRAGEAVVVEGLDTVTCSTPPPRVHIATLDMKTYCSACKREGYIAPQGAALARYRPERQTVGIERGYQCLRMQPTADLLR
ncbi:hypothetical protein [Burkholderia anthina]|uniref:hypothetical protein n=1 Tax=Burkholderia anthina TaxID=179879 RepID=UPI001FC7E948|nr:hypothetical protein [Burkholderia anthina]